MAYCVLRDVLHEIQNVNKKSSFIPKSGSRGYPDTRWERRSNFEYFVCGMFVEDPHGFIKKLVINFI